MNTSGDSQNKGDAANIFPECWKDDMRMNSLFAPFRSKFVNPEDYESKMKFWKDIIERWTSENNRILITQGDLKNALRRQNRSPACMDEVVAELRRLGCLVPQSQYFQSISQGWSGWLVDVLVKKPVTWSFRKVVETVVGTNNDVASDEPLVVVSVLKEREEYVLSQLVLSSDSVTGTTVVELQELFARCQTKVNSLQDLEFILKCLQCQKKVTLDTCGTKTLVKGYDEVTNKPPHITRVDQGIVLLRSNEKTLHQNVKEIEDEIEKCHGEARSYIQQGKRHMAKTSLRKKKNLEKCLENRTLALENIQVLLQRLHDAKTDAQVIEAYKVGGDALKNIFKETGLSEDSAADTMAEVLDALELHTDIERAISEPVLPEEDMSELEKELEDILEEDRFPIPPTGTPEKLSARLDNLDIRDFPSPPTSEPSSSRSSQPISRAM